jgi:hypothetical protein
MTSPETVREIIAKLRWATDELQLVLGEMDHEAASDLRNIIEIIQVAILQLQK